MSKFGRLFLKSTEERVPFHERHSAENTQCWEYAVFSSYEIEGVCEILESQNQWIPELHLIKLRLRKSFLADINQVSYMVLICFSISFICIPGLQTSKMSAVHTVYLE